MNTNINLREVRDISQVSSSSFIFAETRKPVKDDDNVDNFPQAVPGRFQGGRRGEGIFLVYSLRV